MKLLGRPEIGNIALKWRSQYLNKFEQGWLPTSDGDSHDVYRKLLSCRSLEEVDAAIGNDTWTHHQCHECSALVRIAVEMGGNARFCKDCLILALSILPENAQ